MAISAGTVLLVAVGGVLTYAGFTNQNPLVALRAVSTGKPAPVRNTPSVDQTTFSRSAGGGVAMASYADVATGGGLPTLPQACERFAGDRYSQTNRWANGYSDCSSFIGKGLKIIGVKPPAGSTTTSYLLSDEWKQVNKADAQAGDIAVSFNHCVVCYGDGYGIGQQNPRSNVKRGPVDELMFGNKPYTILRYEPKAASTPKSAST